MYDLLNRYLDWISEFLAHRKGLLLLTGILLIFINFIFQLIPGMGWLASSNLNTANQEYSVILWEAKKICIVTERALQSVR